MKWLEYDSNLWSDNKPRCPECQISLDLDLTQYYEGTNLEKCPNCDITFKLRLHKEIQWTIFKRV